MWDWLAAKIDNTICSRGSCQSATARSSPMTSCQLLQLLTLRSCHLWDLMRNFNSQSKLQVSIIVLEYYLHWGSGRGIYIIQFEKASRLWSDHTAMVKAGSSYSLRVRSAEIIRRFFWTIVLPTEKNRPETLKLIVVFGRRIDERIGSRLFPLNGP